MNKSRKLVIALIAYVCLASSACIVCAGWRDEWMDIYRSRYGFTNWVGQTKTNYVCLATNWVPDLAALAITNVPNRYISTNQYGTVVSDFSFIATNDATVDLNLRTYATRSVTNAHEYIIADFSECTGPDPFVEGGGQGLDIGDRCYIGPMTNDDCMWFVRNNVLVRLDAHSDDISRTNLYSVVGLARALDEQIRKISVGE